MNVLKIIFIIFEVLVLFNLLIFVHELGHFLAARWRGLKVDRFAIWFGKPIWKKRIGEVEYVLGSIPAGGYVSLPQMATMETIEGKTESDVEKLPPISPLDKIIVAFAGPLFSFGLAVFFAVIVWMIGRPVSESETTTVIGHVVKDGPADKIGMKPGDRILSVDGKRVTKFGGMGASVSWRVVRSEGETVPMEVERMVNGKPEVLRFEPRPVKEATKAWERKSLRQIDIYPAQSALIAAVEPDRPASRAGLKAGDQIVTINGRPVFHMIQIGEELIANGLRPVTFEVLYNQNKRQVTLTPELARSSDETNSRPAIGVKWDLDGRQRLDHPSVPEQISDSFSAMVSTFGALFSPKSDVKAQHLGGAVKIGTVYYKLFESNDGWRKAIWFSVLMNINLALLNLLPFPVLDGGHITIALIEAVRRRPVSGRLLQYVQTACAMLLIGYMLYIFFYDVQDIPKDFGRDKNPELHFLPKTNSVP